MADQINHIYSSTNHFLLRIPAISIEKYFAMARCTNYKKLTQLDFLNIRQNTLLPNNLLIKNALLISSFELFNALKNSNLVLNEILISKLVNYLIRMSTRPTPYGLFSGVLVGDYGDFASLNAPSRKIKFFARADLGWVLPLIQDLELHDENLEFTKLYTNHYIFNFGNRLFLAEDWTQFSIDAQNAKGKHVSIKNTKAVSDILKLCNNGIDYSALIKELIKKYSVSLDKIKSVISKLIENKFLITNLWPDTFTQDPLKTILRTINRNSIIASKLLYINNFLNKINASQNINIEPYYLPIYKTISEFNKKPYNTPIQVDSYYQTTKSIYLPKKVGEKVAEVAEVLILLSKSPNGRHYIEEYKNKFINKYEYWKEIPISELINEDIGLGLPYNEKSDKWYESLQASDPKLAMLNSLILKTIANNRHTLELNDKQIAKILNEPNKNSFIPSFDLFFQILSKNEAMVNKGRFKILISAAVGGIPAGSGINRFSHLFGEKTDSVYSDILKANSNVDKNVINAEVNYIPKSPRVLNVSIKHPIYEHSLAFWTYQSVNGLKPIYLDELVVGVKDKKFYIRWLPENKIVKFYDTSMLNPKLMPAIARLLIDISNDGTAVLMPLLTPPLDSLLFLPRIEYKNMVLRPAQCTFDKNVIEDILNIKTEKEFIISINDWLKNYEMGRYVYLAEGDNKLLLDTKSKLHMHLLYNTFKKAKRTIIIQESMLEDQLFLEIGHEHYITEFVTSIQLKESANTSNQLLPVQPKIFKPTEAIRTVGSDWLYIKFYTLNDLEDDIIKEIADFTKINKQYFKNSFFIRYSDPESHIRLRLNINPKKLSRLLSALIEFGNRLVRNGMCTKFEFDTYERELGRYGGVKAMLIAEKIFSIDSNVVANVLKYISQADEDLKLFFAAFAADYMFENLGLDIAKRCELYKLFSKDLKQKSTNFTAIATDISNAIRDIKYYEYKFSESAPSLNEYSRLKNLGKELIKLESNKELSNDLTSIYDGYLHMHCNRIFGMREDLESTVRVLLKRASEIALFKRI